LRRGRYPRQLMSQRMVWKILICNKPRPGNASIKADPLFHNYKKKTFRVAHLWLWVRNAWGKLSRIQNLRTFSTKFAYRYPLKIFSTKNCWETHENIMLMLWNLRDHWYCGRAGLSLRTPNPGFNPEFTTHICYIKGVWTPDWTRGLASWDVGSGSISAFSPLIE
jgi:hypothetical protein